MSTPRAVHPRTPSPMVSVTTALQRVLDQVTPVDTVSVSLQEAWGRVISRDVRAVAPFPPFRASTKDGYAVVAADGPGTYPVVGHIPAGHPATYVQTRGQVSYITTGAPLPEGADAVVMVEDTVPQDDEVHIRRAVTPGTDVRPVGADLATGTLVLAHGRRLGAVELGMLATAGVSQVDVFRQPRVTVLSTGDELCAPWETPAPGQIRDSNHITLSRMVLAMGAVSVGGTRIAPDDRAGLRAELATCLAECDMLITSGGVSMGEHDLLPALLEDMGAQLHTERVIMKPGKPFTFATFNQDGKVQPTLIFALPGNPASAMVTFLLFVVPALRKMQGRVPFALPRIGVTIMEQLRRDPHRPEFHRVALTWDEDLHDGVGGYRATSTGSQKSSRLMSMLDADALVQIPAGEGRVPSGAVLQALDLRIL